MKTAFKHFKLHQAETGFREGKTIQPCDGTKELNWNAYNLKLSKSKEDCSC